MLLPGFVRRSLAVVVVLASVAVWADVERAAACSCVGVDAREWLAEGKPAFIGEVIAKEPIGDPRDGEYVYRVKVERDFNADLGPEIELRSTLSEAACGFEWAIGERVGAFLMRDGGRWTTNLCMLSSPSELVAGLLPFPEAAGGGRLALLAAGDFGGARLMALDRSGQVLAYGMGRGATRQVSVCPGARRAVELVQSESGARLAVRDLRSMRVFHSVRISANATHVRCETGRGAALVAGTSYRGGAGVNGITRVRGRRVEQVGALPGDTVALGRGAAYVAGSASSPGELRALDLRTGESRRVTTTRGVRDLAVSPEGRRLALVDRGELRVLDLSNGRERRTVVGGWGPLSWFGSRRLLVSVGGGEVRVYDERLRLLETHGPYRANGFARVGGRVFGMNGPLLVSLDLNSGVRQTVGELPDEDVYDLEPVPGRPLISAPGTAPAPAATVDDAGVFAAARLSCSRLVASLL